MKNTSFLRVAGSVVVLACSIGSVSADPVDRYVSLDVHNPRAFALALNEFRESGIMEGTTASLWAATFDGSNPTSHVLAISYDDYADMQNTDERVRASSEWSDYLDATDGTNDVVAIAMGIQRLAVGSGWHEHGAGMVFNMTVSDPGTYAVEFTRLIESMDNPGSVRLIEMRAGGDGATHLALITAPDFVSLNTYMDELLASNAYRDFARKVSNIRRINGTSIYRRLSTWD